MVVWALTTPLHAADLQVEVRVDVQRGCLLTGQQRDAGIGQLGVLDFGSTARLDDPAGPLGAALANQRLPRLECNPDTPYQIRVDGGLHGGVGEVRYMAATAGGKPIPYRLYRDAARQVPLAVNVPLSGRVPDSGTVELPLYARIDRLAQVPRVSRYSDLVKVTVTW
ncbi:spore coat U domain-containing protein [Pseudomonas sp. NPDC089534]|uniref:Csu type fimbrial protein n=1 Tax=Pseudomonas sp. NPDC089534 TaxID=3364468 RepID=UPI00380ED9A5